MDQIDVTAPLFLVKKEAVRIVLVQTEQSQLLEFVFESDIVIQCIPLELLAFR